MNVEIAEKMGGLFTPCRYKVYEGGRGGGKSWAIARAIIVKAKASKILVLCTREFQGSIKDSVLRLLSNQIDALGLASEFEILQHSITHKRTGSEIIFEGLKNNVTKIKSMEGVDLVWCEEAESISEFSWEVLIPTIRKKGSEIWISFNPADELDPTYQQFVIDPPPEHINGRLNCIHEKILWSDNPWFPKELRIEMDRCKEQNYKKYLHIWMGEPNSDYEDSIIQPEWVDAAINAHEKLGFDPLGIISASFDPADEGEDKKACALRHGSVITKVIQWPGGNIESATDKAFDFAFDNRADEVIYDNIGVGAAVKMGLDARLEGKDVSVIGFGGADTADWPDMMYADGRTNKQMFKNKRAQYWWLLRDRFEKTFIATESGRYTDPEEMISISGDIEYLRDLKSELCRVQRKRGQSSQIQLESKQEMRSRGVKSPNMADSLAMVFAGRGLKRETKKTRREALNRLGGRRAPKIGKF